MFYFVKSFIATVIIPSNITNCLFALVTHLLVIPFLIYDAVLKCLWFLLNPVPVPGKFVSYFRDF